VSGILLALVASVGYGISDVLSGTVVRRHATAALALWAQVTGLVILSVAAAVRQPGVTVAGVAWGAAAGAVGASAVLAFYTALQRGRTSIVAPVAGAGVVIPVVVGVVGGDPVNWLSGVAVVAIDAGIVIVAAAPEGDDSRTPAAPVPRRGGPGPARHTAVSDGCVPPRGSRSARSAVWLSIVAALGFGTFFVMLERATADVAARTGDGGFDVALGVALAVQIGALAVTLLAATRHSRACLRPRPVLMASAVGIGLLDVGADLSLTLAVERGPLAVVSPLASLDPVVSVLIATVVFGERLRRLPALGILLALGGSLLIAIG
jgi:drug/metabolite transporter (DMT)-like permease